jgi:hypothetical protein
VRLVRARDDEKPRRVTVESVDDPGSLGLLSARDRMREEPVHERPARVPGRRVDDHAGRLVDDEEGLVLVPDTNADVLGYELRLAPLG